MCAGQVCCRVSLSLSLRQFTVYKGYIPRTGLALHGLNINWIAKLPKTFPNQPRASHQGSKCVDSLAVSQLDPPCLQAQNLEWIVAICAM